MSVVTGRWGPRKRTQEDMLRDAETFIAMARPHIVAAETADAVCNRFGVKTQAGRKMVAYKLQLAQSKAAQ